MGKKESQKQTEVNYDRGCFFKDFRGRKKALYHKDMLHRNKNANSLFIVSQVIVHHNHYLLIWDAILTDNLVGMAGISLREKRSNK